MSASSCTTCHHKCNMVNEDPDAAGPITFPSIHTILQKFGPSLTKLSLLQAKIPHSFHALLSSGAFPRLRCLYLVDPLLDRHLPLIQQETGYNLPHLVDFGTFARNWEILARDLTAIPRIEPLNPFEILLSSTTIKTLRVDWEFTSISRLEPNFSFPHLALLTTLHLHIRPLLFGNDRGRQLDTGAAMEFLRLCSRLKELYIWGEPNNQSACRATDELYPQLVASACGSGISWLRLYHGPLELLPIIVGTRSRSCLQELAIKTTDAAMKPHVDLIVRILMKLDTPDLQRLELGCREWDGQLMFCVARRFPKLVSLKIVYDVGELDENDLVALGSFSLGHLRYLSTFHLYEAAPLPRDLPRGTVCPQSWPDPGLWHFRLMQRELIQGEAEPPSPKTRMTSCPRSAGRYRRSKQGSNLDDEVALRILKKWKRFLHQGSLSEVKLVERGKVWTRSRDSASKAWREWSVGVVQCVNKDLSMLHGVDSKMFV
ncbi:hypothetical protein AAF712_006270 [Marasmius tenuissimus]|uniref:Uncharacterized protein n=1 Tax=Marasmius tenuissimus TaxID=585030 RepID=A0ABR3A025_9AGAR